MTATIHDLSLARRAKIIREAKDAMRNGLVHLDPMAAWYSPLFMTVTTADKPVTVRFSEVSDPNTWSVPADLIELPCDTEPK